MMTRPVGHPEAIVRPKAAESAFNVERLPPGPALAEFVDYYWLVRWAVMGEYRQQVVPQPRIHLAAEQGRLLVHGVNRKPFYRTLTGTGFVLGVAFHAGGFRPFLRRSAASIAGRVIPAGDLLGRDDRPVAARLLDERPRADSPLPGLRPVAVIEDYLLGLAPEPDPIGREVTALVAEAERDHSLTRAEALAERSGGSLRSLQRLFADYLGIGPKWVISRFRLLDAAATVHSGEVVDWAELADRLGFSDQAHLTRMFTQVVGTPLATYARDPATR